ncbi:plastocyanin/azurin family copper-binding protein [Frankia sp. AiPa1]|uniref:cupredoxin domain-containing protein n=1 Tax=Frankia sp. AiPa1 TaxID=573492 RepID=UPI00202B0508|nr:plastocyanin/azurin family copper-binding protein [Frankia sp. AiPa1]MCL9762594.1 cupredoxin family copper-binding protein [Frankia sp. AiPa1]
MTAQSQVWWRRAPFSGVVLATVALTVLAACGSSGNNTAAAAPPAAAATAAAGTTDPAAATPGMQPSAGSMPGMQMPAGARASDPAAQAPVSGTTVDIRNFAFSPANLTVRVGTTVAWTNRDADAHTVVSTNGPLHSPTLNTGDTYKYTFAKAGSYSYLCSIHPFMVGTVVVTA